MTTQRHAPTLHEGLQPTLSSRDYCSPTVYAAEQERIFHRGWVYLCHVHGLPAGTKRVFDVAGESIVLARTTGGDLHAFANVCRHRGAQLCDAAMHEATKGSIRCQYHAWTYGLDGSLLATPRVDDEFDRGDYALWQHHVDTWNGMVFVSLATSPLPLADWLERYTPALSAFAEVPVADYVVVARTEAVVAANWKVIVENYAECLHCAVVHPELTDIVPLYRTGNVVDPDRDDGQVFLRPGASAFTVDGTTARPRLPGLPDGAAYDGAAVFPNVFFDLTPTVLALTAMFPIAPDRTVVVGEYLFGAADAASDGFDPTPEVEFNELIGAQDYVVCEMVQRGVSSRAFSSGGLTAKDRYVAEFVERYLDARGTVPPD